MYDAMSNVFKNGGNAKWVSDANVVLVRLVREDACWYEHGLRDLRIDVCWRSDDGVTVSFISVRDKTLFHYFVERSSDDMRLLAREPLSEEYAKLLRKPSVGKGHASDVTNEA